MKAMEDLDALPRVPISTFKANPAHYLASGALVTNHGRVRAAFVPVVDEEPEPGLDALKAQLRMLTRLRQPEHVADELAALAASRDSERVERPR